MISFKLNHHKWESHLIVFIEKHLLEILQLHE